MMRSTARLSYNKTLSSSRGNERPRFGKYVVAQQRMQAPFSYDFNPYPKEILKFPLQTD